MSLHLPVVHVCNLRCVFCSAAGREDRSTLTAMLRSIDEEQSGHVQISGGEPFLMDPSELLRLLARCRKRRLEVELQTNGVAVPSCDAERFRMIAGLVSFFNVNFPAHDRELDYALTRTEGAFEARLAGVRRMLGAGAAVRLTHVVCRPNLAHCAEFVEFVRRELRGVSWIQFSYVKGAGLARGREDLVPRYAEAAGPLEAALDRAAGLGIPFDVDHIPPCFLGKYSDRHVDCRKMLSGEGGAHLEEKRHVPRCEGCRLRPRCPGPRKDYLDLYEDL
ncbi:MAG: radical SAM protein [Elusimicrobiota bacterium]